MPRICRSGSSFREARRCTRRWRIAIRGRRSGASWSWPISSLHPRNRVRNTVWITADVHYCAAHHYDPSRARFTEFDPFWEFVAGPLHAGTFRPNPLDGTFGPEVRFSGVSREAKNNRPPSEGFQFFGTLRVDARTRALTVQLRNIGGKTLYSIELGAES